MAAILSRSQCVNIKWGEGIVINHQATDITSNQLDGVCYKRANILSEGVRENVCGRCLYIILCTTFAVGEDDKHNRWVDVY